MGLLALEIFLLNSSFQGLKFVWCWGKAPVKDVEERERILDRVGSGYRLCILGDLNG